MLYDDMVKHVEEYPELHGMLGNILFGGQDYPYHEYDRILISYTPAKITDRKDRSLPAAWARYFSRSSPRKERKI